MNIHTGDKIFLCCFAVDASLAGSGNIEIMVNDGSVHCHVDKRGVRQFRAYFVPVDAIPHYIQIRFNGFEVPGGFQSVFALSEESHMSI